MDVEKYITKKNETPGDQQLENKLKQKAELPTANNQRPMAIGQRPAIGGRWKAAVAHKL